MRTTLWRAILGGAASLALTIVFPMMLLIVFATLGVFLVWRSLVQRQWLSADWARAIITGLFASPLMIYYLVLIYSDPVVAEWYAQDAVIIITPSPWQALIGYGFLVPLAIAGAVWCVRQRRGFFLMVWAILALGLVYTPIALQCRLLTGLHVCIALLAALGLIHVVRPAAGKWRTLVLPVAMLLLVPSTLAVMVFHASIVTKLGWPFFITTGERAALTWLQESVPTNEVVLASPKMGLMIPAWAGQRVVYGHPLETIAAAEKKTILEDFFAGKTTAVDILRKYEIRYIFVGPKEKELGDFKANQLQAEFSLDTPYVNEEVTIYRLSDLDGGEH